MPAHGLIVRRTPPDEVRAALAERSAPEEEVLLWQATDIGPDGAFAERWLAVTSARLAVVDHIENGDGADGVPVPGAPDESAANAHRAEISYSVPLAAITNVAATNRIGYVALEVESDGRRQDVARGTNARAATFHHVARAINERAKNNGKPVFTLEEEEEQFCPKCGRLLPEKNGFCPKCLKTTKVLARVWKYMRPHWPKALLMTILVSIGALIAIIPPYLTRYLIDDVLRPAEGATLDGKKFLFFIPVGLFTLVAAFASLHALGTIFRVFQARIAAWLGGIIMHDVRFDLYQAIQALTFRRFDRTQVGTLMSRLLHDTSRLNFMLTDFGGWLVPTLLQMTGIVIVLFRMNWTLAVFMLLPVPLFVFSFSKFHTFIHRLFHRHWLRQDRMSAVANDSLTGLRVVKAFAQEPREIEKFGMQSYGVFQAATRQEQAFATWFPVFEFMVVSGSFLVWYFGGRLVLGDFLGREKITLGTLMAFISYMGMFYGPLHWITMFSNHLNQAITAAQRLFEIIDAEHEVYDDPKATKLPDLKGKVEFRGVRFGYRKDKEVLKDVTLTVEPGEMIGLVGRSGVGKTTMTNLICRFYDVDEGAILIDGVDIRKLSISDHRRQIGIVPQESFLFSGTITENISYAKPDASPEDIIRASMAANALGFILRQPEAFDTKVGGSGGRLSGGEKQRIAIARAILHNPRILILDEATSSVDTETEDQIQTALHRLVQGRTTFAIAHRLSTLKYSNRLVVLDDGKVAEIGTHDELVEKKGVYARLVEMQSKLSSITAVDG